MPDPQQQKYLEDGFLVVKGLVSAGDVARLRQHTEDVVEGRVEGFPPACIELEPKAETCNLTTARKINRCAENDAVFMEHARHRSILQVVQRILGTDVMLFGSQCFMKPPGGVEKPYHQDSAYFSIEPMALVTCWTALDDVTLDNGCMWVVRGSHREGLVEHSEPWMVGGRQDMQVPQKLIDSSRETPITMSAGDCSFHHSLLLHRSTPNNTSSWRRGLAVHYMSAKSRWTDPHKPQPDYPLLCGTRFPGCV